MRRLRAERGLPLILVTHNLAVVSNLCDRPMVMNAGKIPAELAVADLRRSVANSPIRRN
jgi:ABC-type glutathione transport system ATPase component